LQFPLAEAVEQAEVAWAPGGGATGGVGLAAGGGGVLDGLQARQRPIDPGRGLALSPSVGVETAEGVAEDVDVGEPAGKKLEAEVSSTGKPDVRQKSAVAVASVLGGIAFERDPLALREAARTPPTLSGMQAQALEPWFRILEVDSLLAQLHGGLQAC
jgi:hypothetical protein